MSNGRSMTSGTAGSAGETELHAEALSPTQVVMQSISHLAPAIGVLFTFQFAVGYADAAIGFTFAVAGLIVLMLAISLSYLAREMPSAGGYYTYIARVIGPRMGFLTSWLFVFYSPFAPAITLAFTGWFIQQQLDASYGFAFPWWAFFLLGLAFTAWIMRRGVKYTGKALVILGIAETVIVLGLGLWGFFATGSGGFNLVTFDPAAAPDLSGIVLGVVFSIFAFTGWEGAAPMAEESRMSGRSVARALIISTVLIIAIKLIASWGLLVGWGTTDGAIERLTASETLPPIVLADGYFGDIGAMVVILALLNSALAVSIATANVGTRMWFGMGRAGALPAWFAKVDPRRRTPVNAVTAQIVLSVSVGFGFPLALGGPGNIFGFWGLLVTYVLVPVYIAGNVAVFKWFRGQKDRFNPLVHAVFPLVSSAVLVYLFYKSLNPLPSGDSQWAPVVALVWLIAGAALAFVAARGQRAVAEDVGVGGADAPAPDRLPRE